MKLSIMLIWITSYTSIHCVGIKADLNTYMVALLNIIEIIIEIYHLARIDYIY